MEPLISWDALLALANTFGVLLIGVAALIGSEALRLLAGWKTDETVAALRRRLADVEAIRARGCTLADCKARMHEALTNPIVPESLVERHLGLRLVAEPPSTDGDPK